MTAQLNPTGQALPTIKEQFTERYIVPVQQEYVRTTPSQEQVYELAKERYEAEHGHQFPYGFRAWQKHYYGK